MAPGNYRSSRLPVQPAWPPTLSTRGAQEGVPERRDTRNKRTFCDGKKRWAASERRDLCGVERREKALSDGMEGEQRRGWKPLSPEDRKWEAML